MRFLESLLKESRTPLRPESGMTHGFEPHRGPCCGCPCQNGLNTRVEIRSLAVSN